MPDRDLLQGLYLASGLVLLVGYGPQLRQLMLHPDAGVKACPLSSWLLWTGCRVVALMYCAGVVRDVALTVIVGLDVGARLAVLLLLARARARRRRTAGALGAGRWILLGPVATALLPLLMGCRSRDAGTAAQALVDVTEAAEPRVAWLQRHALNLLLLPLLEGSDDPRWRDPHEVFECDGRLSVLVDGRPIVPGTRVPVPPSTLEWRGEGCALAWGGPLGLSGHATLRLRESPAALMAEVLPEGLVLPMGGVPVRLEGRFLTSALAAASDDR